jgi:hypothetical protein
VTSGKWRQELKIYSSAFVAMGKYILTENCLILFVVNTDNSILGLDNLHSYLGKVVNTRTLGVIGGAAVPQIYVHWYDGIYSHSN